MGVVLSAAAAACGSSSASSSNSSKLESTVVFSGLGGTFQTDMEACALNGFESKYHVTVDYQAAQPAQSLGVVEAQKSNPTIDVLWESTSDEYEAAAKGLVQKLTYADFSNSDVIPQSERASLKLHADGIPIATSIAGLEYNEKVFKAHGWAPPTSWADLWNPKYKGHVGIYTLSIPVGSGTLVAAAGLAGGSQADIQPGFAKVKALKPNLLTIYTTAPPVDQAMLQGQLWIVANTGARALALKSDGVGFVKPTQGEISLTNYLDIVKGAPHPNAAKALVNYMLTSRVQACFAKTLGYGPVDSSIKQTPQEELYNGSLADKSVPVDWYGVEQSLPTWLSEWNKEIEGS